MARTAGEAINQLKKAPRFRDLDDSSFASEMADQALKIMWGEYPWRQSLAELPPFYMTPNEQDHVAPDIEVPTNFHALDKAWIRSHNGEVYDLRISDHLIPTMIFDRPKSIAYMPEISGFRLHPSPAGGWGAPWNQVEGVYKIKAPDVTPENMNKGELPWEDEFFEVYKQALKYVYFDTLGLPDAGQVVWQNGSIGRTGQLGKFWDALMVAVTREETQQGDEVIAPAEGLALG